MFRSQTNLLYMGGLCLFNVCIKSSNKPPQTCLLQMQKYQVHVQPCEVGNALSGTCLCPNPDFQHFDFLLNFSKRNVPLNKALIIFFPWIYFPLSHPIEDDLCLPFYFRWYSDRIWTIITRMKHPHSRSRSMVEIRWFRPFWKVKGNRRAKFNFQASLLCSRSH